MEQRFDGNFPYRSRGRASGCCLLGILFAAGAVLWYAAKALWIATKWFFKYLFLVTYWFFASPFLLVEYLWRQGGAARTAGIVLTVGMMVVGVLLVLTAPAAQPAAVATQTVTLAVPTSTITAADATATPVAPIATATDIPTQAPTEAPTLPPAPATAAPAPASPTSEPTAVAVPTEVPTAAAAAVPNPAPPTGIVDAGTLDPAAITDDTRAQGKIVSTVDGDTVRLQLFGKQRSVRLIGVDTPETRDPRRGVQCYGREAAAFTQATLNGVTVQVTFDVSQGIFDKYDRPLVYLWLPDGTSFNQRLIAEGYAFEYTYNLPYRYQTEHQAAEADARTNARGLWAPETCNGVASTVEP